jgi:hypothetical protein
MAEPAPVIEGLVIEAVDWLPSGGRSGLVRVCGRWEREDGRSDGLPELVLPAGDGSRAHASLPDSRLGRDAAAWRGAYMVEASLLAGARDLELVWPDGRRATVGAPEVPEQAEDDGTPAGGAGGEVVEQAVLAELRARRAEAAQAAQARLAEEAQRAVEALEHRTGELTRELQRARALPPAVVVAPAASDVKVERIRAVLSGAVTTIAELRSQMQEAGLTRRTGLGRTSDAVRLALLEAELERLRAEALEAAEREAALLARAESAESGLEAARAETAALQTRLDEAEAARGAAEATAAAAVTQREAAEAAWASIADELAELRAPAPERPALPRQALGELARTLATQAAAQPRNDRLAADLDAAAAALRSRTTDLPTGPPPIALREALVRLADEDAVAAGQLIAGLLAAQWRIATEPLEWDLTIDGVGTFACSVTADGATVERVPRPRRRAKLHLRADGRALAGMLAGEDVRARRFRGPVRVRGRRRLPALEPATRPGLPLAEAVRSGARLDAGLVLRCLALAVPPEWTAGHDFTVTHSLVGDDGAETVIHLTALDGRGLTVTSRRPIAEPVASVRLTAAGFNALLAGDAPGPQDRPAIRGDHRAVEQLRAWADRVRTGS